MKQWTKAFEKIIKKAENAGKQHFLLFPQCLFIFQIQFHYLSLSKCVFLQKPETWTGPKMCHLVKGSKQTVKNNSYSPTVSGEITGMIYERIYSIWFVTLTNYNRSTHGVDPKTYQIDFHSTMIYGVMVIDGRFSSFNPVFSC